MKNLHNKFQILQFIIIISFYILSFEYDNDNIIDKNAEYYQFLLKILKYNEISKKFIKKKISNYNEEYNKLLENNEYFYVFYSGNVYTYFFREKGENSNVIYFNGITNVNDIQTILSTIMDVVSSNFNYENIEKLLNKKGILYESEIYPNKYSLLELFDYLYHNIYSKEKLLLKINGFSLGGPISQLFTILIKDKYKDLDIEIYNVESWFGGNKEIYENMKNKINISNIYNKKSLFYFFNIIFQKYFKATHFIHNNNFPEHTKFISDKFPNGLIHYVVENHLLSKIFSNDK